MVARNPINAGGKQGAEASENFSGTDYSGWIVNGNMIAPGMELQKLFRVGERLSHQKKSDKKTRYSIHEVQVECIGSIFEKLSAIATL